MKQCVDTVVDTLQSLHHGQHLHYSVTRIQTHRRVRGASSGVTVLAEEMGPRRRRRVKLAYHWSDSKVGEGGNRGHSGFSRAAWTVWRAWPHTGWQLWRISWVWAGGSHTWEAEEKLSPAPPLDTNFWTHQRAERREDPQRPCRKFVSLFLKSFWPWSICQSPSKCLWSWNLDRTGKRERQRDHF